YAYAVRGAGISLVGGRLPPSVRIRRRRKVAQVADHDLLGRYGPQSADRADMKYGVGPEIGAVAGRSRICKSSGGKLPEDGPVGNLIVQIGRPFGLAGARYSRRHDSFGVAIGIHDLRAQGETDVRKPHSILID